MSKTLLVAARVAGGNHVAATLLQADDGGVLAPARRTDVVARRGDPLADITATEPMDVVMKAGRIGRHRGFDVFAA